MVVVVSSGERGQGRVRVSRRGGRRGQEREREIEIGGMVGGGSRMRGLCEAWVQCVPL